VTIFCGHAFFVQQTSLLQRSNRHKQIILTQKRWKNKNSSCLTRTRAESTREGETRGRGDTETGRVRRFAVSPVPKERKWLLQPPPCPPLSSWVDWRMFSYYNYFTWPGLFALLRSLGMSAVSGISLDIVSLSRKSKRSAFTLNPSSSGEGNATSSWARPKQVAISSWLWTAWRGIREKWSLQGRWMMLRGADTRGR